MRESCARARAAVGRARASRGDASKSVPTYGAEDAFFIGATARSGRGAYAARALAANEVDDIAGTTADVAQDGGQRAIEVRVVLAGVRGRGDVRVVRRRASIERTAISKRRTGWI